MAHGKVIHIQNDEDLQKYIDQSNGRLVVVDFTATWCQPCRFIAPIYSELSTKYSDTDFLKVDVDECQLAAAIHQISAMPTFLFFVDKRRVDEVRGADPNKLESAIMKWRDTVKQRFSASSDRLGFIVDLQKVAIGKGLSCFNDLKTNENSVFLDTSGILLRYAENVLKQPGNPKYRAVRLGNEIFQKKLFPVPGAVECLFQMGFQERDDKLILPEESSLEMLEILRHTIIDEQNKRKSSNHPGPSANKKPSNTAGCSTVSQEPLVCQPPHEYSSETVQKAGYRTMKWMPRRKTEGQVQFFDKLKSNVTHVFLYENKRLQEMARQCMQLESLQQQAKEKSAQSRACAEEGDEFVDERDCLLLLLLDWFKNNFFSWMNQPVCTRCNVNTQGVGSSPPTNNELMWGAGIVELYRCSKCSGNYRFPRYNHPQKLLDTRTGRCGEWANCFTLCCIAAGFEARFVLDWTDHVWTEVYSEKQKRWLHCDPCENVCDKPLLYEAGWGKKLTYLIAFSKEEVVDVSWRYSAKHKELMSRRKEVPELWLGQVCFHLTKELQSELPSGRKKLLAERSVSEHVQFLKEKDIVGSGEKTGRISGSLAWRRIRGETGLSGDAKGFGYIFVPTLDELKNGRMRLRYCSSIDKYYRGENEDISTCTDVLQGWEIGVATCESIIRKVENDWDMVYLARQENCDSGSITWSFRIDNPSYVVDSLDVIAQSKTFESGIVKWTLDGDKGKTFTIRPAGGTHDYLSTPILRGSRKFNLSAHLSGGDGSVAWQHAQLFRQRRNDNHIFSLDIIIHFLKRS